MSLPIQIEKIAINVVLSRPTAQIMYLRATADFTLTNVDLYRSFAGGIAGTWYFNIKQNGASLWSGTNRLAVNLATESVSKTGLSISVTKGDVFTLELEVTGSGTINGNLVLLMYGEQAGGGTGDAPVQAIGGAVSDESTAITTGNGKLTFRLPFDFDLSEVRANLNTGSSSGTVTVDINQNGSSILSTKLTIDASEKTSQTAATPPVISNDSLDDDDEITIDIDGAGTGAKGLKVWLIGTKR